MESDGDCAARFRRAGLPESATRELPDPVVKAAFELRDATSGVARKLGPEARLCGRSRIGRSRVNESQREVMAVRVSFPQFSPEIDCHCAPTADEVRFEQHARAARATSAAAVAPTS
jgi:hypothetical protein